jgi:hypothetical protein
VRQLARDRWSWERKPPGCHRQLCQLSGSQGPGQRMSRDNLTALGGPRPAQQVRCVASAKRSGVMKRVLTDRCTDQSTFPWINSLNVEVTLVGLFKTMRNFAIDIWIFPRLSGLSTDHTDDSILSGPCSDRVDRASKPLKNALRALSRVTQV